MTYTGIVCFLFVLNVFTVVVSATNSTNCVDATFINCNDSHVCHDDNLKTYCPLTCGLCKPCKDQAVFACSKNVCSFPSLKKFCPVTCSSCGEGILGCTYKSKHYQQSERWEDGCDYKCTCLNAEQGLYRCTERCVHYQNVPTTCRLVQDPNDQCCKVPKCDVQVVHQNTTVNTTGCLYKGQVYSQGQKWSDGCDYNCECLEATTGHYRCQDKCPTYTQVPQNCPLVKTPDGCCYKPNC
ncbi:kielin/chordin-like protein [Mytilus californianus]|uniref:kielin/chordin-like protein n=1 Tax=Mytilus californianus TaxID=6549 RepID=UPI00224729F1|nr:kielin/chordin-like protein [Mytilus californianus]